eukprot:TRINITY_DN5227_c0_g1_i1.p1 TRINITY_DN5227_c0_g1~~TRINITY_DN5227_c0_g1_i1.p1  ORF type:complete len:444 (-),score=84.82 TRINITY_DN5227_c0_g1_i1:254-1585(-)
MEVAKCLSNLPQELWDKILLLITDDEQVKACRLVCQGWRRAVDSSAARPRPSQFFRFVRLSYSNPYHYCSVLYWHYMLSNRARQRIHALLVRSGQVHVMQNMLTGVKAAVSVVALIARLSATALVGGRTRALCVALAAAHLFQTAVLFVENDGLPDAEVGRRVRRKVQPRYPLLNERDAFEVFRLWSAGLNAVAFSVAKGSTSVLLYPTHMVLLVLHLLALNGVAALGVACFHLMDVMVVAHVASAGWRGLLVAVLMLLWGVAEVDCTERDPAYPWLPLFVMGRWIQNSENKARMGVLALTVAAVVAFCTESSEVSSSEHWKGNLALLVLSIAFRSFLSVGMMSMWANTSYFYGAMGCLSALSKRVALALAALVDVPFRTDNGEWHGAVEDNIRQEPSPPLIRARNATVEGLMKLRRFRMFGLAMLIPVSLALGVVEGLGSER